jgi:hypothetical protein
VREKATVRPERRRKDDWMGCFTDSRGSNLTMERLSSEGNTVSDSSVGLSNADKMNGSSASGI